ncbi:MAG: hypothetical protein ACFB03_19165 [Paracoccaceae bacterium]
MTLNLDRLEIEDAGSDPVRLARAILKHLPELDVRVPIEEVVLDILSIEVALLASIEVCLQCDARTSRGRILYVDKPEAFPAVCHGPALRCR